MKNENFTNPMKSLTHLAAIFLACCVCLFGNVPAAPAQENSEAVTADNKSVDEAAKADETVLQRGERLYAEQCLSCHGENGKGQTEGYTDPLIGDASIGQLAEIIAETMPEEDPDLCVGDDAKAVAEYVHQSFYSEAAQLRNRPAQVAFSRLTGRQLQQSLADLYTHFYSSPWFEKKQGLSGSYFDSNRWDSKKLKVERTDKTVDFSFGHEAPVEGVAAEEFYIHWSGSLNVEHTGRYEIVVHSTCSMKLHLGHQDEVLIDNHVQSEGKTEFRETLNLLGGRQYPISIDFTQRKRKTEQPPAELSLRWIPPGGVEHVIPAENLYPGVFPSSFALQTKLPPDDRSYGYERGTRVDRGWEDAVTKAAFEFGNVAAKRLWPHYRRQHRDDSDENRGRLRGFLTELASVAFQGELDEESKKLYVDDQLAAAEDDHMAILRSCLLIIKSPRFLYPSANGNRSRDMKVASRLAMTLYDSIPADRWLLDQAKKGELKLDAEGVEGRIRQTASRMVRDPRLRGKVIAMFFDWLDVDPTAEINKDESQFAGFDQAMAMQLRRSLEQQLSDVFWSDASDYRQLFLRDWNYTNEKLASFYGETFQPEGETNGDEMVRSRPDPERTFGVLTHPMITSHLSYFDTTSPIHRGVFLIRRVLGRTLRPPNEAFTPLDPDLHPDLTTRQRVELQTGEQSCQVCHQKINALGFSLENYDAVGRFRAMEKGKPINAAGSYVTRTDQTVPFESAGDLARFLAENDDAHRAFVERVFEYFVKQPIAAFGPGTHDKLTNQFRESQFNMRELIVEIAVLVAMDELNEELTHEAT
ncbi:DUF1588 domain-containing protein [Stieleria sp. JC731]|uniref:DUF1588 domain-containing protein n=1 Tax=Pirellulaceae TaxID=2691357 RepID=UPI001E48AB0C|nr:DUF1588 domain-containing protein [Stieleria sp. JC731]MCC9601770.1 DUF1588 domain-containing protein [Stieleria sp. JC731]